MQITKINPNMLVLARQVRGITQSRLAKLLGVSQGKISKMEQGLIGIDDEIINGLSKTLSFPRQFFFQSGQIFPDAINLYRKRQTLTKTYKDQINSLLNIQYQNLAKLLESVEVESNFPFLDLDEFGTPQNVARQLRYLWKIPPKPIADLTSLIENAGVFVIHLDVPTPKFDGIRFVADSNVPIIALNRNMPPDRMRFTLAHELGHFLMHTVVTPNADKEADVFASEFLVPADAIEFPVERITLTTLADLKRYWKVSMASLLMKAKELGVITYRQYQYLWMQMGKLGYRKREPKELDPPFECTTLIRTVFRLHLTELGYSEGELRELFMLGETDFHDWWGQYLPGKEKTKLRLIKGGLQKA